MLQTAPLPNPPDPWTPVSRLGVVSVPNLAGQAHVGGVRPPDSTKALLRSGIFYNARSEISPMSVVPTYDAGGTEGFGLNRVLTIRRPS